MRLLICIDDTDSKTSEKGTGAIADDIRNMISTYFEVPCSFVSRHQLLIHPDVPYTSHNSSMCFATEIPDDCYDELKMRAQIILMGESDMESDPGLAIADIDKVDKEPLIRYAKECKRRLMTKEDAYAIAEEAGFFLKELGGTGDGIIGAAAGVGLRLWGCDGTMKGRPKDLEGGKTYRVRDLKQSAFVEDVLDTEGNPVPDGDTVTLPKKTKVAIYGGRQVILLQPVPEEPGVWETPDKERMKHFGGDRVFKEGCPDFTPDVEEEQTGDGGCYDCLYRRWMEKGVFCQKPEDDA